ncbi:MAG: hypothetical protein ABL933_17210 [Methyloglobulus sp.]|nr:hypothetical protein [Methyloglobulus sp.]
MTLDVICESLRNPAGMPSHPAIFLGLLVLTWAMHIIAVHVMLGSTVLSLFGSYRNQPYWRKLSQDLLFTAKVAVGIAVVLGVAPLLFVQTLYDQWYVSNLLSARWVLAFIVLLIAAYYGLYYRYYAVHHQVKPDASRLVLLLSFVLLLCVGFIMHVLTSQMLRPDSWMAWYAPQGQVDTRGAKLHDYNLWRYLYFIGLAIPVTGAWLMGDTAVQTRRTKSNADYANTGYLAWLHNLGERLIRYGGMVSVFFYVLWMITLPEASKDFAFSFGSFVGLAATIALATLPYLIPREKLGVAAMPSAALAILLIAVARENLRIKTLFQSCHYDPLAYPVHFDGYSTLLFFLSLVFMFVPIVSYFIMLIWGVNQTQGVYDATPRVRQMGRFSLIALGVWIAHYFIFGAISLM